MEEGRGSDFFISCTEKFRSLDQVLGNGAAFDGREACMGALTAVGKPEGIWSMKDIAAEGKSSRCLDQRRK